MPPHRLERPESGRRSARAELRDAGWLAIVPIAVAVLFGVLLLPRRADPDDVPVPIPAAGSLAKAASVDRDLARRARSELLPGAVRALGSAIRQYHTLEGTSEAAPLAEARRRVDDALTSALPSGQDALLQLRAVQLEGFLDALRSFEATGVESDELMALGGRFVASMRAAGWCSGHALLPGEPALRTMFKEMWNALLGLDGRPGFEPSLDEQRALYAFVLAHPHPSAPMRAAIEAARRGAHDTRACEGVREAERSASEAFRLERIARLAAIDPDYPAAYARGVASFRRADYRGASTAFRAWLTDHPDGPLALRAQSFLRASDAAQVE
jgi:hypothetical protein